jgi:hypothetical protein
VVKSGEYDVQILDYGQKDGDDDEYLYDLPVTNLSG